MEQHIPKQNQGVLPVLPVVQNPVSVLKLSEREHFINNIENVFCSKRHSLFYRKITMKKVYFLLFSFSFVIFLFVLFCVVFILCFPFGVFRPVIDCDTKIIELGTVESNDVIKCRLEIQNKGNLPLYFQGVKPGCGSGNDIENISFSIESLLPDEKRECTFLFRPRLLNGRNTKKVVIYSNDPQKRYFIITINANVISVPQPDWQSEPTLAPVLN
jgi:hypothetical protein